MLDDGFLASRGFFTPLEHPEAGTHPYAGLPIHLSCTPGRQRSAAPCLGQHTREVLAELLQLDDDAIEALERDGTTIGHTGLIIRESRYGLEDLA